MNNVYKELPDNAFQPVGADRGSAEAIVRPSISFWRDVARRLFKNKVAVASLVCIVVILLLAMIIPELSPYRFDETNFSNLNASSSAEHWFGTDNLGRDIWTRVWVGARVSLFVGFFGAIIPSLFGIVIGGISGYFGGKLDMLIMRIIDICMCIPQLIYVILLMIYLGSGPSAIIIALAITAWMGPARTVRGLVLSLKEQEFVLAARTLGASPARLIFVHLIPNTLGIVIVGMTMMVPAAIFAEATLSFIGLGVKAPMTSWGQLANAGVQVYRLFPSQMFIPALFICITVLSFNLFGDGLRDALDPRLRD
ncbi:MAG: ABC transporter permease [Firmicutes bacterium]|nr:ABC transporter permease [Bacillota bacterium]